MNVHGWCVAFAALAVSGAAQAAEPVTLYVQEPTTLSKSASPTADVVEELPAGEMVTWQKSDAPKKGWFKVTHKTDAGEKLGFVQRASLATDKPNLEVAEKAQSVSDSNQAIASSGAANKSAAEEAHTYADAKGLGNEIGQLEKLEQAAAKVDHAAVIAHAKKDGLVVAHASTKGGK